MSKAPPTTAFTETDFDWFDFLIISAIGAMISIVATGYVVGVRNDIYYLPVLDLLYDEPQFATNSFIQSLRYFSSGPWLLLSGAAKRIDTYWLLLLLDFLSRFFSFAGMLACANLLGVKKRRETAFLTALLCSTSFLRGQSLAGDGGLFINYFTHSEIANGLTLFILFLTIRGCLITAIVINGTVFFINAFIGVWDAAVIAAVTAAMALNGKLSWRSLLVKGAIGTALAALVAEPVIRNILTNPDFGKPLSFDYVTYLEEFWPYHFIFSDIETREKFGLGLIVALGIAAFVAFGKESYLFIVAMAALIVVYIVGTIIPHVTHNPLILNLHLLRVSTMLQLFFALSSLTLATKWWFSNNPAQKYFFSPILILVLCTPIKMTTIQPVLNSTVALLVVAASYFTGIQARMPNWLLSNRLRLNYLTLAIVTAGFSIVVVSNAISNARAEAWLAEWTEVGNWAKKNTALDDTFLIPTWNFRGAPNQLQFGPDENDAILNSGAFESIAHRSIWIDFRNGAAVLWSPSYYDQWHQRVAEVNTLTSFSAKATYAKANGIGYLIDTCKSNPMESAVFLTKRLCVYRSS